MYTDTPANRDLSHARDHTAQGKDESLWRSVALPARTADCVRLGRVQDVRQDGDVERGFAVKYVAKSNVPRGSRSVPKSRSLRHTVIATLLIGFALLSGVQFLLTGAFVANRVQGIEAMDAFAKLQRLHYALDQLRDELARTNADWAIWDDAFNFVTGKNPAFPEENLPIETFQRLNLNVIVIVDDDGRVLFARMLAPNGAVLTDATQELIAAAQSNLASPDRSGFVASSYGPMIVSIRQIQDSQELQLSKARMLMGRALVLTAPVISRVTAVPMTFDPLNAVDRPMQGEQEQRTAIFEGRNALFLSDQEIHGYSPIDDVWGKPLAMLHAQIERSLQPGLARARRFLFAITLFVGAVFGLAGLFVLRKRVVKPIEQLVEATTTIGSGITGPRRLDENHHALEFIALSKSINSMLSQIELQQTLRADRDAAIEANRLKSEFLATMSHEIRTPMNGVLGMCELLQRTELNTRQRHLSDTLLRSAKSLLGILNDILDFSKIESGKLLLEAAPFSLHEVIQNVNAPFATAAQAKGIEFATHIDAAVPPIVIGDALRIRQVLNNLVSNAVKFTKAGAISVHCSVDRSDANGVKLRIVVKDSGIGIAPAALPKIFEAFAQAESSTTRQFGGTGLGLAIVRRIVELMGGEVGVNSEQQRGSSFWFTMQLQRAATLTELLPANAVDATGPRFSTLNAPSVLLAEDNPVNREVLTEMLEVIGCKVQSVENGAQALAAVAATSFDAILMDCQMPVMDGHAATAELRVLERETERRRSFIVALTADATLENRERCFDSGMDAVMTKPISQARLRDLVMQAVRSGHAVA
jgi:signal transduction histidine kinase/ActR/RegA family two-component response regulator